MSALLLIPVLFFILIAVPQARLALAWFLTLLVGPILVRTRHRYDEAFRPRAVERAEKSSPLPAGKLAELSTIGFTHRGSWVYEKVDGLSTTHLEVLADDQRSMIATISQSQTAGATQRIATTIMRLTHARPITVSDAPLPGLENTIELVEDRMELPTLARPTWLVEALQARIDRAGNPPTVPIPRTTEEWTARLSDDLRRMREAMRTTGLLTAPDRRGNSRFTLGACFRLPMVYIWPQKQRFRERSLAKERAFLTDAGLLHLLNEAERSPEAASIKRATEPVDGTTIPDDRGTPRAIAQPRALKSDDRRLDPRFAATIAQSQSARQGQFRRITGWLTVPWILLIFAARAFLHIPIYVMVLFGFVGLIVIGSIMNAGRAFAAERAAADRLIRRGLCPSCLYGLEGLQAEPDGCLVCPECGGAWTHSRVQEFTRFSDSADADPNLRTQVARAATSFGLRSLYFSQGSRTKDARDREVVLVSPLLRHEIAGAGGASNDVEQRLRAARRAIARSGRFTRWLAGGVMCLLFVALPGLAFVTLVLRSRAGIGLPGFLMLLPLFFGAMLTFGVFRGNFGYRRNAVVQALLASRLCPACAEDLSRRQTASDGCVECLCGAAWRVAPPTAAPSLNPPAALPLQSPEPSSSCTASSG